MLLKYEDKCSNTNIERCPHLESGCDTHGGNEKKARQISSQDGPERVQGVKETHAASEGSDLSHEEPAEDRKGRPHEGRGNEEDQKDEDELNNTEGEKREMEVSVEPYIDKFGPGEKDRGGKDVQPDGGFHRRKYLTRGKTRSHSVHSPPRRAGSIRQHRQSSSRR